nr:immunoglobulin heavy chain junction region [Mus musculus]
CARWGPGKDYAMDYW